MKLRHVVRALYFKEIEMAVTAIDCLIIFNANPYQFASPDRSPPHQIFTHQLQHGIAPPWGSIEPCNWRLKISRVSQLPSYLQKVRCRTNNASRSIYRQTSFIRTFSDRIGSMPQRSTRRDSDQSDQQTYPFENTSDRTDHAEYGGGDSWKASWEELACAIYSQA